MNLSHNGVPTGSAARRLPRFTGGETVFHRASDDVVVIRRNGAWLMSGLEGPSPRPTGLDGVLSALAGAADRYPDWPAPANGLQLSAELTLDHAVDAIPTICGIANPGCVLVEDPSGELVRLTASDVALIDRIDGPTSMQDLARELVSDGSQGVLAQVSRLLAVGMLRYAALESPQIGAPTVDTDATLVMAADELVGSPSLEPQVAGRSATAKIPVYAFWQEEMGPLLSLGMLTASARTWKDGLLNEHFEIRRPEPSSSVLSDLRDRNGPAVLLCSDYVWSLEFNLDVARQAKALCPDLLIVHGGPSSPKYPADINDFHDRNGGVADVLVRGEGEQTLCELLEVFAGATAPFELIDLSGVTGVSFVADGDVVVTPDRERQADLDALPSPFLSGEFDHIPSSAWITSAYFETNRGCPYGCSFCDWGSATMARLRKFSVDRVAAELRWAAERGIYAIQLCDANFGILKRDVEIAQHLASIKKETGFPFAVAFTPAKSTTRHLRIIFDELLEVGLSVNAAISLQTIDPDVLEAVDRSNISTDIYLQLAADLRRRGLPLVGDLILGLPLQTYDTYRADLQFFMDHEISARTWSLQLLPNAPMNNTAYRERYGVVTDEKNTVVGTSSSHQAERSRMERFRNLMITSERLGLLRHVLRYLQWDFNINATDFLDRLLSVVTETPARAPVVSWTINFFDEYPVVLVGWRTFYSELRKLIIEEFPQVPDDAVLHCVLQLQQFLMPRHGRTLPATTRLANDYVAYYQSATDSLYRSGHAGRPERPLAAYGPADFTIEGDPLGLCEVGLDFGGFGRDEVVASDFHVGAATANELNSVLTARLPATLEAGFQPVSRGIDEGFDVAEPDGVDGGVATPVQLQVRQRS